MYFSLHEAHNPLGGHPFNGNESEESPQSLPEAAPGDPLYGEEQEGD